ncbi:MAG: segregation ATPase FtsK/SpoIIIE, family [Frankiaceae bacterium]|nr:segregation ATPase FtsK/SpoIIIE, family [Frankiaceae bacterium]
MDNLAGRSEPRPTVRDMASAARGQRLVARPVRSFPPALPTEPVMIAAPPAPLEPEGSKWATTLLPALSSLGIVGFAFVSGSALYIALGVGMAVLAIGATVGMRVASGRSRARRHEAVRARYSAHLDQRHTELTELAARQRQSLEVTHPDPSRWPGVVASEQLWERRPADADFLVVRIGRGRHPLAGGVRREQSPPTADEEADLRDEAALLVAVHAHVDDVPLALDLRTVHSLGLTGPAPHVWPALRALVLGVAVMHAPGEVSFAGLVPDEEAAWLGLLPHTLAVTSDPQELARLVAGHVPAAATNDALGGGRRPTHSGLVLVVGAAACRLVPALLAEWTSRADLTCLVVDPDDGALPPSLAGLAGLDDDGLTVRYADGSPPLVVARPEAVGHKDAERLARELAGCRTVAEGRSSRCGPVRLRPLLELPSEQQAGRLAVPLGQDTTERCLELDLAEAALGGSGPHGLLIGATGSGKSELLRTVIAGLVYRFSPDELGLVCWDFKGGAAVLPFAELPHVRGTVTNLESEPRLLERADRSLRAEMRRRQQLLRNAGVDSVADYRRCPAAAAAPLPTLVLVVDEFSELLGAAPDLLDLFVSLGRLGRSLGIHLLLASQRLDEGRLRGLESHLRYRICLRTFSAADSTTVLGTDAAYRLPATPGSGLLAVDGRVTRFDAALADGLEALVAEVASRWAGVAVPDATLWEPPLPDDLAPLHVVPRPEAPLLVTVGLVDRPDLQCREPLQADLAAGHLAIVGAPRSGRSTAAAAVVAQFAASASPQQLQVYVLTDGSPALADVARLPHVGTVGSITDGEQVTAIVETLTELCRSRGSSGSRGSSEADDGFGVVVLVVDDWVRLRRSHESAADAVTELAASGLTRRLHLVVTGGGWGDFRAGLREHLSHRWELRLADPYESEHGKARAATLSRARPGRLLTPDGHEAQIARPALARVPDLAPTPDQDRTGHAHRAPALRALPATVPLAPLLRAGTVCLGVGGGLHTAATVDVARPGRHLVVAGDGGSGRSTALRTVLAQLDPARDDLWVMDRRRSLLTAVPPGSRYAFSPRAISAALADLAEHLRDRLPVDEGVQAHGGARFPSPEAASLAVAPPPTQVLVIDDYDLLPSSGLDGGLGPLTELLPFADEIGLSVVVARRNGGRVGYDQGWQLLVEGRFTGLALSGDPMDGLPFPGVRPRPLPPGRGQLVGRGQPPRLIHIARAEGVSPGVTGLPAGRAAAPVPKRESCNGGHSSASAMGS